MDRFWLEKAKKYIQEHNAFENVSDIFIHDNSKIATISAIASVNLPSRFIKKGRTNIGVKDKEIIHFVFIERFPLVAPKILLREDFPRCFPHINPSEKEVSPCIYDGNLTELLQQSEWMNGILNQLIDWLEKAAANELLNFDQGWEPMRNDQSSGLMLYDIDEVIKAYGSNVECLTRKITYEERDNLIFTDSLCFQNKKTAHVLYCMSSSKINTYVPNVISTLSDLYHYADSIEISSLKEKIEDIDKQYLYEDKLFVVLLVKRPINLIGSNINIEFLNFVIHKSKKRKKKKRVLADCEVGMLSHIIDRSPDLLRDISGTKTKINESKSITLLGCGSLGSKIGVHLARNGNGPFLCVDNDIFLPHNNARHALTFTYSLNKAELLSKSTIVINNNTRTCSRMDSAINIDYSNSRLIIDTTASLSVRNFLMTKKNLVPIITGALYGRGFYGLLLLENNSKTVTLKDLWAYLYWQSLNNETIRNVLFSSELDKINIGQSCSSQTLIVDDSRISIIAASMSLKIQQVLENGLSDNGEILFLKYNEDHSLSTESLTVLPNIAIPSKGINDFNVFLNETVYNQMKQNMQEKTPNETGGVLLGTVFLHSKTIIITDVLLAPPDSIEKTNLFILGTEGLEKRIRDIEKHTNGKVTYLGTWHSHPNGGSASRTDENTIKKLLFVRNHEPTICIILTPEKLILI